MLFAQQVVVALLIKQESFLQRSDLRRLCLAHRLSKYRQTVHRAGRARCAETAAFRAA